jgi:hypothetical protein
VIPDEPDIWNPYAVTNPLVEAEKTDVPEPFLTESEPDETIEPVVNTSPAVTEEKYVSPPPPPPVDEIVICPSEAETMVMLDPATRKDRPSARVVWEPEMPLINFVLPLGKRF